MPVPTSNQGAESKRWLKPLLASSEASRAYGPSVAATAEAKSPGFVHARARSRGRHPRASRTSIRRLRVSPPKSERRACRQQGGRRRVQAVRRRDPLRPEPWFRSCAGTLTRPTSARVAHLHSEIAGLSAEIARDALVASRGCGVGSAGGAGRPGCTSLSPQLKAGGGGDGRRWPSVDGADDLAAVYALQIDAGDAEVGVLALDHHERDALVSHLDCVRVP